MARVVICVLVVFLIKFNQCKNLSVKISYKDHINEVSDRFLSFTVDPKSIFAKDVQRSQCLCMATTLSPAYIRIAGPSTKLMDFQNTSILFKSEDGHSKNNEIDGETNRKIYVDLASWKRFAEWAKQNSLKLVIALNDEVKTAPGLWDPHTALSILSLADEAGVSDIVWQLGYECRNRSVEEYLNELETLRVMVDTFPHAKSGGWKVAAGDVRKCLSVDSKSDFADFVSVSNELMDAVFLNGNSTAAELEKMPTSDKESLLQTLANSSKPLWITELRQELPELEQAVDWLASLGYSARNGFDVHFRDIRRDELGEASMSFLMAVLFKTFVGRRVLDLDIQGGDSSETILFAHCATVLRNSLPGGITLYGANVDAKVARFTIESPVLADGGDVMQFILSQDGNGNILANGQRLIYKTAMKPVFKRVHKYRPLTVSLPPKSFGFWVLARANIEACMDDAINKTLLPAKTVDDINEKIKIEEKHFQNRIPRAAPLPKNDVILHKAIGDSAENWNNVIEQDATFKELKELGESLKNVLTKFQKTVNIDGFYEKVIKTFGNEEEDYNKDEMTTEVDNEMPNENLTSLIQKVDADLLNQVNSIQEHMHKALLTNADLGRFFAYLKKRTENHSENKDVIVKDDVVVDNDAIDDKELAKENLVKLFVKKMHSATLEELNELEEDFHTVYANIQKIVNTDGFFDNVSKIFKERPDYIEKLIFKGNRQKRQTVGEQFKSAFTKLKTSTSPITKQSQDNVKPGNRFEKAVNAEPNIRTPLPNVNNIAKPTLTKLPSILAKFRVINGTKAENFTKPKNIVLIGNINSKNSLKAEVEPRRTLKDAKKRLDELRSKLVIRNSEFKERTKQIKEELKQSKRIIADIKEDKNNSNRKYPKKRYSDLSMLNENKLSPHAVTRGLKATITQLPQKPTPINERKRRSIDDVKKKDNEITTDLKYDFDHRDMKNNMENIIFEEIGNKIKDKFKISPIIKHFKDNEVEKDEERKNIVKKKVNELVKEKLSESEEDAIEDQIIVKTKISDDDASLSVNEKSNQQGLLRKVFHGVTSVVTDLKDKLTSLWVTLNAFD